MAFNAIVGGPHVSRPFGRVIRLNLSTSPETACGFACANDRRTRPAQPRPRNWRREDELLSAVHAALTAFPGLECVLLSGPGEPTLHPRFASIVDGLVRIRARRAPALKLAVVSNASRLDRVEVRLALSRLDLPLMELDAGDASTVRGATVHTSLSAS